MKPTQSTRHPASTLPFTLPFKKYSLSGAARLDLSSCFMGEVAHCRFTRQHPSGQLTAGRQSPVSVDVALVALTGFVGQNEQRSRLVTCGRCNSASKQTVGLSHPC